MRRLSPLLFAPRRVRDRPQRSGRSPTVEAPPSKAIECRTVDTSVAPTITSYVEGGVEVHTFLAPELNASTATHVIERRRWSS